MLALKVKKQYAEELRKYLLDNNLIDRNYKIESGPSCVYFPVNKKLNKTNIKIKNTEIIKKSFKKIKEEKPEIDISSYDMVGDILIVDEKVKLNKGIICNLLKLKNIETIVKKTSGRTGKYRIKKHRFIAGVNKKTAIYKENGLRFKLNIDETYFSPRLSGERLRIAKLIKPDESVLVMFSGIAPYPLNIIKQQPKVKEICGIEINKKAHEFALESLQLNKYLKINKIRLYCGDVRKILPKLNKKFNRIVMPLPKTSESFLGLAFRYLKKNGIIHLYKFSEEDKLKEAKQPLLKECRSSKKRCKILKIIKCGQHSPYIVRICIDFKVK